MSNMAEKIGRSMGISVGAWLLASIHLAAAWILSYAVEFILLANGAYKDLQTSTFSVIVALGVYNIFLYCYKDLDVALKGKKDEEKKLEEFVKNLEE